MDGESDSGTLGCQQMLEVDRLAGFLLTEGFQPVDCHLIAG